MNDRHVFAAGCSGATFVQLRGDNKAATGSFTNNPHLRLNTPPESGNFGVIPGGRMMIIDIDGDRVEEQRAFFEELLELSRYDTVSVRTQSGGVHVYATIPADCDFVDFPKGSLRSVASLLRAELPYDIEIDADIRIAGVNSYVVGPGSVVNGRSYEVTPESASTIGEVSHAAVAAIKRVYRGKYQATQNRRAQQESSSSSAAVPTVSIPDSSACDDVLDRASLRKLRGKLAQMSQETFHRRRAFVFASMRCCFSDAEIVDVWRVMGLHYDSSKTHAMSAYDLAMDMARLRGKSGDLEFHGGYCQHRRSGSSQQHFVRSVEENMAAMASRVTARDAVLEPVTEEHVAQSHVVNMSAVEQALGRVARSSAQHVRDAVCLVEAFVQPVANVGGSSVVLARSALSQELHLSDSRVAQALRLLTRAQVLHIVSRQRTGLAAVYAVDAALVDTSLTAQLHQERRTAQTCGRFPNVAVDARTGTMVEAFTGRIIHDHGIRSMMATLINHIQRYAREEREWRALMPSPVVRSRQPVRKPHSGSQRFIGRLETNTPEARCNDPPSVA